MRPLVCNYNVTLRCNDTCEFCEVWQNKGHQDIKEAGIDEVKRALRDLRKLGVPVMNFTGGEPALRDDLPEILKESKRLGFFNILTTNGIAYAEKATEITANVDHLIFSLDAAIPEEHNRIRGVDCYNEVMEGIKTAKGLGKLPLINFTITRDSIQILPDMVDLAQKLGVLLWVNPVYNWSGFEGFDRESVDYISRYIGRKNAGLNLASLEIIKRGGNDVRWPVCTAGSSSLTLLPDNTLVSPCFYLQKSSVKLDEKLANILKRKEVKAAVSLHGRDVKCKGCMAWPYISPSFLRRINKNMFLALYSLWSLFLKESSLKKGVFK